MLGKEDLVVCKAHKVCKALLEPVLKVYKAFRDLLALAQEPKEPRVSKVLMAEE
jgi:hypothetical protein